MNGIVESFTEYGCDGKETALVEPLYTVLNEKGGPEGVKVIGEVGEKPDWGPAYCNNTGCFLPAYYFNKVEQDPRACPENGPERYWMHGSEVIRVTGTRSASGPAPRRSTRTRPGSRRRRPGR